MSAALPSEDDLPVYAVRIAPEASAQAVAIYDRIVRQSGLEIAEQWREDLREAWGSLATLPLRCPVADENDAFQKFRPGPALRVLLVRQGRRIMWRVLFTTHVPTANDPAFVQVHLIRHGAQAPLLEWSAEDSE